MTTWKRRLHQRGSVRSNAEPAALRTRFKPMVFSLIAAVMVASGSTAADADMMVVALMGCGLGFGLGSSRSSCLARTGEARIRAT